ncbi:hypothetical protein RUND412_007712 [Rhizina undulata]
MDDSYQPRDRDDDEISLISMQELAPAPMEDEENLSDGSFTPTDPSKTFDLSSSYGSISSLTRSAAPPPAPSSRGARGGGLATFLTKTQKYSSYAFSTFLGLHATTVSFIPLLSSLEASNSSILLARTYFYQSSPWIELLLIPGTLLLHVGSGLGLRIYRDFQQRQRYGGAPPSAVSQWSLRNFSAISLTGWISVPFVAAHAALLRGVPLRVDGDSSQIGIEFMAHGFRRGRWGRFIGWGFYGVMVGMMSYHVVFGWTKWLKVNPRKRRLTTGTAVALAGAWLSGLYVVVSRAGPVKGYLGRHYDHLYSVFFSERL